MCIDFSDAIKDSLRDVPTTKDRVEALSLQPGQNRV
jgi:hypothetical protein